MSRKTSMYFPGTFNSSSCPLLHSITVIIQLMNLTDFLFFFVFFFFQNGRLPKTLQMKWFMSAIGSYGRASRSLFSTIQNSDLDDLEQCRIINDRIMGVNLKLSTNRFKQTVAILSEDLLAKIDDAVWTGCCHSDRNVNVIRSLLWWTDVHCEQENIQSEMMEGKNITSYTCS